MTRPRHNIPEKDKGIEYVEQVAKYYEGMAMRQLISDTEMQKLRGLAFGEYMNMNDYTYVINPLNKDQYKNKYPARLRNRSLIAPMFKQLLGEKFSRIFDPQVVAENSDINNRKMKRRQELAVAGMEQAFVNQLIRKGQYIPGEVDENGQPIQPPRSEESIIMEAESERDTRSVMGQNALDYIYQRQEHGRKTRLLFADMLASGVCVTYKHGLTGDVDYNYCYPPNIFYSGFPQSGFLEDCEAVRHDGIMSLSEVIDLFNGFEEFTDDIIEDLSARSGYSFGGGALKGGFHRTQNDFLEYSGYGRDENGIRVSHLQWKGLTKIGKLPKVDEDGELDYVFVDEFYLPLEGEVIEWRTVNQVYETFIIDDRYHVGYGPIENQRGSFTNPSKCKLQYNGYISFLPPITKDLEAEQIALNIVEYNIEKTINKNKDSIIVLPLSLVPKKAGWDEYKSMYYADAHGILFVDDSDKAAVSALSAVKSIDWNMSQHLQMLMQRAATIRSEAGEKIGFNRFRQSNINASDAVSNVQQGQYAGSLITEYLFKEFEEFEQREAEGLLDISKTTFTSGMRAIFTRRDGENELLEIDDDYAECEYNIFVRSGGKAKQILEAIEGQMTNLLQHGMTPSGMFKALNSGGNAQKLIRFAEESERRTEEITRQKEEADRQATIEAANINRRTALDQMDLDYYRIDTESATKLEIAEIGVDKDGMPNKSTGNLEKFTNTMLALQMKREELQSKERIARMQDATARYTTDKQLQAKRLMGSAKTK